jgi:hypothetical protein
MGPIATATFAPIDGLRVEVRGSRRTVRHYLAEYGPTAAAAGAPPDLVLSFGRRAAATPMLQGGHKGLRWRVELSPPSSRPIEAAVALVGDPRSFGLSLLQGYVIEPLLGLLAVRSDDVLLPAAAVEVGGRALLVLGRSRSGKSSVTALAASAGLPVLGDDHVVVHADGVSPFPRRLRVYPDIRRTAPAAHARLGPRDRTLLRGLAAVRAATRGLVAPPLRVPVEAFGRRATRLPLGRVVVVERRQAREPESTALGAHELVGVAASILREQRRSLEGLRDPRWLERLEQVRATEESLLERAFAQSSPATLLALPADWEAPRAVARLAAELGLSG